MSHYIGSSPNDIFRDIDNRFFYAIRRNDSGELFLAKIDQSKPGETITLQRGGISSESFQNFDQGQDFFEGRDVYHEIVYDELRYEQFKWDNRDIFFYVDADGYFTIKVNENHTYDDNASSTDE